MNKQELINKAVVVCKGEVSTDSNGEFVELHDYICRKAGDGSFYPSSVCTVAEFKKRARELGWINGYKWGVEYPTNGVKPDLPDDVVVSWRDCDGRSNDCASGNLNWHGVLHFRIVDERYKPVEQYEPVKITSTFDGSGRAGGVGAPASVDWYCYEQQKAIALPPVGAECEMFWGGISKGTVEFIAKRGERIIFWRHEHDCVDSAELPTTELKPLDHATRAKELERKRVVDAVMSAILSDNEVFSSEFERWCEEKKPSGDASSVNERWLNSYEYKECTSDMRYALNLAYDKGFLKLP